MEMLNKYYLIPQGWVRGRGLGAGGRDWDGEDILF